MKWLAFSSALMLALVAGPAASARMYQWNDPDSGTPQLSGKPPYWYRSGEAGPRIFVIENGRVVDDTSVTVTDAQRQQLREQAFLRAEQDEAAFREKIEEARRLKSQRTAEEEQQALLAAPPVPAAEAAPAPVPVDPEAEGRAQADAMRALVEEWERIREETARKVIHE